MSASTENLTAIADVYAGALVEVAREESREDGVTAALDEFVGYVGAQPEFAAFLGSETIESGHRRDSLEKLFRGRLDDLVLNLLQVLNARGRLGVLDEVRRCVQLRMEFARNQKAVMVETAIPLTDELRAALKQEISERIGREALLTEQVRPELIGGFVVRIDDVQIDASVAAQIEGIRRRLRERAVAEIRENADRLVQD